MERTCMRWSTTWIISVVCVVSLIIFYKTYTATRSPISHVRLHNDHATVFDTFQPNASPQESIKESGIKPTIGRYIKCPDIELITDKAKDSSTRQVTNVQGFDDFKKRAYENTSMCTVKLITHKSQDPNIMQQANTCTFDVFKKYYFLTGQFHGSGTWYQPPTDQGDAQVLEYYPDLCSFPSSLSKQQTQQYADYARRLQEKNITRIVFSGDSTMILLFRNFIKVLNSLQNAKRKVHCTLKRSTSTTYQPYKPQDAGYFEVPQIPREKLLCLGCGIMYLYECKVTSEHPFTFYAEFIKMEHTLDATLKVLYSGTEFSTRTLSAETKLEYLLKYYFPHHGFPDFWVFLPPFLHEVYGNSDNTIEMNLRYALELFNEHLPATSQLVFKTTNRECEPNVPLEVTDLFCRLRNTTRNAIVYGANQMLSRVLRPHVANHDNYQVFLDFTRVTCPVTCVLHQDGAHMKDEYQQVMSRYLLDLMTNEV